MNEAEVLHRKRVISYATKQLRGIDLIEFRKFDSTILYTLTCSSIRLFFCYISVIEGDDKKCVLRTA